ncbi:MAG: hypothetical protein Q9222_002396 [Ikaeria aurantiellina]
MKELLQLFAQDQRCNEIMLKDGRSMAGLAKDQLKTEILDSYGRFSIYLFPDADLDRAKLLAQSIILVFIFDDLWESSSPQEIESLRSDFVALLQGNRQTSTVSTPLERIIDAFRNGLLAADQDAGNGGVEILETFVQFCNHTEPPRQGFRSMSEYLDYRWEDVANGFTWSCAKFAIKCSADQDNPQLRRLLRYLGDHISIANDIASYEKEKRAFDKGKASAMINIVDVIVQLEHIDVKAAKCLAYARQLLIENDILEEMRELKSDGKLGVEEWRFVDACLTAASGNLLTSVVMSRYGGEGARIAQ